MDKDILKEAAEEFSFDEDIPGLINKTETARKAHEKEKEYREREERKREKMRMEQTTVSSTCIILKVS